MVCMVVFFRDFRDQGSRESGPHESFEEMVEVFLIPDLLIPDP